MNTRTGEIALLSAAQLPTLAGFDKALTDREAKMLEAMTPPERVDWAKRQPRQQPPHATKHTPPHRFKARCRQSR